MTDKVSSPRVIHTVIFAAPHQVHVASTPALPSPAADDVHVTTVYSAISPGTELLVYNGHMPPDVPTDALFASQHTHPFRYPSPYGYCVAGIVNRLGPDAHSLRLGQPVFAFREHTSAFLAPESDLHPIPAGIPLADACFLPNVETAISLAMDAALLPGESACVVGQGVVGLLLVAALKRLHPYSTVVAIEPIAARRHLSTRRAGADAALDPADARFSAALAAAVGDAGRADVSVDVSGAPAGLDAAIEATRDHGRVVIGSWFGAKEVTLGCLGGRFHRSHMHLVASQVSCVPPAIAARWSKQRRFDLAWRLLRDLRPSKLLPILRVDVNEASRVYKELAEGKHLLVMFEWERKDTCGAPDSKAEDSKN